MARPATRQKYGTFFYQREGSPNWYYRLRHDGKRLEKSTGTPILAEARARYHHLVGEHLAAIAAAKPRWTTVQRFAPGREHVMADGTRVVASDTILIFINPDGTTRQEPNAVQAVANLDLFNPVLPAERPKLVAKDADDALFQHYLEHGGTDKKGIHPSKRRDAMSVFATFKELTGGKALKDCLPKDIDLLADHYRASGLKTSTVHKKIMWLSAMFQLAMRNRELNYNPCVRAVPASGDDTLKIVAFSDADIETMKTARDDTGALRFERLRKSDQVLIRFLACTGMRLGEACKIKSEETVDGVRVVHVGSRKTKSKIANMRPVPLPSAVLDYLPPVITGTLFGDANSASGRLGDFKKACGITAPTGQEKHGAHSFRHRAISRLKLKSADVREDMRKVLFWGLTRVADEYGGFATPDLKEAIDKVGF